MGDSVARGDEASRIRDELVASRAAASHAAEAIRAGTLDLVGAAAGVPHRAHHSGSARHSGSAHHSGSAMGARLQPLAHPATRGSARDMGSAGSIPDWGTLQPSPMGQTDPLWRDGGMDTGGRMTAGSSSGVGGSVGIAGSRRARRATPSSLPSLPRSDPALSPATSPQSSSALPPPGPALALASAEPSSGVPGGRADRGAVSPRIANRALSHHAITPAHFATVTPSDLGLAMPADTRAEFSRTVPPDVQRQLALLEAEMSTAGLDSWASKMQTQSSPPQARPAVGRDSQESAGEEQQVAQVQGRGSEGGASKAVSKQLEAMRSLRERLSRVAGVSLP
jgi:hypothetical protein